MNTTGTTHGRTVFASLCVLTIGGWAAATADVRVGMDQVPEAARAALQQAAGEAPLLKVSREHSHGVTVYEGKWSRDGEIHEAEVTADGALIELEEATTLERVPAAVRAAILKHFGGDATVAVEKKTLVRYEAETMVQGKEQEVTILPTGRIVDDHDDPDPDDDSDDEDEEDDPR